MLHAPFDCPRCGTSHDDGVWAFRWGALAGETYELGDHVRFDEPFSFFRRVAGHPNANTTMLVEGQCSVTDQPLWATLTITDGRLMALHAIRVEAPLDQ